MEVKKGSDFVNDRNDLQVGEKALQRPDSPNDHGKDVGKDPWKAREETFWLRWRTRLSPHNEMKSVRRRIKPRESQ